MSRSRVEVAVQLDEILAVRKEAEYGDASLEKHAAEIGVGVVATQHWARASKVPRSFLETLQNDDLRAFAPTNGDANQARPRGRRW